MMLCCRAPATIPREHGHGTRLMTSLRAPCVVKGKRQLLCEQILTMQEAGAAQLSA